MDHQIKVLACRTGSLNLNLNHKVEQLPWVVLTTAHPHIRQGVSAPVWVCMEAHTQRSTYFISCMAVGQWRYLFLVGALCFLPFGFLCSPFIAFGVYSDSLFSSLTLIITYFFSSYFSVLVLLEMPFAKLQPFLSLGHFALTFSLILPGHKPSVTAPLVTKGFQFLTVGCFFYYLDISFLLILPINYK